MDKFAITGIAAIVTGAYGLYTAIRAKKAYEEETEKRAKIQARMLEDIAAIHKARHETMRRIEAGEISSLEQARTELEFNIIAAHYE